MAKSKVNFTDIGTRFPEPVNAIQDLIKEKAFEFQEQNSIVTIVSGIDYQHKVGFYGKMSRIGKKANGTNCSLNEVQALMSTSGKDWNPQPWDTKLILCAEDVEATIGQLALKKGIDLFNIQDTELFDLFEEGLIEAIAEMYSRFIQIADKDAANVSDSPNGYITDGIDVDFVNVCDGFWKRARAIIAANPSQRVAIAANDEATTEAQYDVTADGLTPAKALQVIRDLYKKAPNRIKTGMNKGEYKAYCTQEFFTILMENWQDLTTLESKKIHLENGLTGVKVNNIDVIPVPMIDELIAEYENLGAKMRDPFRVIVMQTSNALVGVPDMSTWGNFKVHFSEETDQIYVKMKDKIDFLFLHDNDIMVAI